MAEKGSGPLIAIDGPAGSGKSTLARLLAETLGLPYVNTGLMYRALTLSALRKGIDPSDEKALAALAGKIRFDLNWNVRPPSIDIDGAAPSPELRSSEVERRVSEVSAHLEVRALMKELQRNLGERGAVVEGRDIGSAIFPEARVKIFLVAASSERVARRAKERVEGASGKGLAAAEESVVGRDRRDARVNTFVPAKDAVLIDTSARSADAVFEEALGVIRSKLKESP